jgi:hypothetical protein
MGTCGAGCLIALGAVVSLHAQEPGFWAFLEPGRVITRCAESSPGHQQAAASLRRLDEHIEALKNADATATVEAELHALFKVEGCAAQRVPAPTLFRSRRAHNLNDVSATSVEELDEDFAKAFDKWKTLTVCRSGAR